MKLFTLALVGTLVSATQAATNFKGTCSTASNQMASLAQSLSQIKAIANQNGHKAIASKCDEASQHLSVARNSWTSISNSFMPSPWEARSSVHASRCQTRLSSCGSSINWIHNRPEMALFPAYQPHITNCRRGHSSCETTCGQIWNWPSPPGYKPKPSGYYRRHRREATKPLCPLNETACPISPSAPGHECLDTQTEITSCGGCATRNEGENCLIIEGADEVGCESGECIVFTAQANFTIDATTKRPVAQSN